ncbi:microtubule-associated tyrosine carboxypeptidase isoform X1 [Oncorhynchus keta]|uniref:microtubule-associated tyrosine carboxypeptidase isoform X1 n=2 Tax=Oncorhynchus keta TaxID=8018 RepID=UPI00227CA8B1|nr:microtubule-associated tyrosine carboxypeptidase isoform X1 [Oncorhynchus keta]
MVLDPGEDCMDRTDVDGVGGSSSTTDLTGPEPRPDPRKTTTTDSTGLENTSPEPPITTTNTGLENTSPEPPITTTNTGLENTSPEPPITTTNTGLENTSPEPPITNSTRLENTSPEPPITNSTGLENTSPEPPITNSTRLENTSPEPPITNSTGLENTKPDAPKTTTNSTPTRTEETRPDTTKTTTNSTPTRTEETRPDTTKTTTNSTPTRTEETRPDTTKTTTNSTPTRTEETRPDTTKTTTNSTPTRTEETRPDTTKTAKRTEERTADPPTTTNTRLHARTSRVTKRERVSNSHNGPQPQPQSLVADVSLTPSPRASVGSSTNSSRSVLPYDGPVGSLRRDVTVATASSRNKVATRPALRRPLSLDVTPLRLRGSEPALDRGVLQPPWRSAGGPSTAPSPPARSLTSPSLGPGGWMRRSESTCTVNNSSMGLRATRGRMRPATSLPHIARGFGGASPLPLPSTPRGPCLLVALRPINLDQERQAFFQSDYKYDPQFEYSTLEPSAVLEKYKDGSDLFLAQAVGIMECILRKFGNYENFEEVTGGSILPKSRVWAAARKYLQKENCVGEVVVCLSDELLSQAVMMVESCRPTLTINLSGARQHWLEGMLRHEIGTHYLRGVNNNLQPWSTSAGRKQYGLKPANPTEEGLASLHSVLLRKQPYLWRAALLYYTVYHATRMGFSQLFSHIAQFVQDPAVRWEYCLRAKRGQTDTSEPGCFSKDQVYLDGILRILRHRRNIDFKMLTSLGKVSFEDVERLRHIAVLRRTRIPHFMQDQEKYLQNLDNIVTVNELSDAQLRELLP